MMKKNALLIQLMLILALLNTPLAQASKPSKIELDQDDRAINVISQTVSLSCKRCNSWMQGDGYSEEGDCFQCELNHYPSRFQGCPSCRLPQKKSGFCQSCRFGFKNWIEQTLVKSDNDSAIPSDHEFYQKLFLSVAADKIMDNHKRVAYIKDSAATRYRNNNNPKNWVGFYIGNFSGQNLWTGNPQIMSKDIEKITYDTAEPYLRRILRQYYLMNFDIAPIIDKQNGIQGMRALKK